MSLFRMGAFRGLTSVLQLCEWLEATRVGLLVRESLYGFQIVVAIHILGLAFSVGTLVWFDLRLLGRSMPCCRVSEVYRRLAPWMLGGFAVMLVTGSLLFTGFATRAYGNLYFRLKMLAMLTAGVNALVYHAMTERRIAAWDSSTRPPMQVRLAGLVSIGAWTAVIMAGRMMSYTMF
jgi:hypothetical protein